MLAQSGKVKGVPSFQGLLTANGTVHLYDGINLAALAMVMSHSTDGCEVQGGHLEDRRGREGRR